MANKAMIEKEQTRQALAAKGKYPFFLKQALRMLNDNGIIFADNILYKGYVMSDYNKHKQSKR